MADVSEKPSDAANNRLLAEAADLLSTLWHALPASGKGTICGVPEGYDACLLAAGLRVHDAPIIHICRDDARMSRMAEALEFFDPDVQVFSLPAWDCLPYDRVSPNPELAAGRLETIAYLADKPSGPYVVLTTVSAALQLMPPQDAFQGVAIAGRPGSQMPQEKLLTFFSHNGYRRAGTVREPGEYALRGGIVDVFPPGEESPLRMDFFGDELESIRRFDAMTQRTLGDEQEVKLIPVSEVILDDRSIADFRDRYRKMFGVPAANDVIYESVSAGQRHPGVEHWLPLFWGGLESIFDYLPDAVLSFDHRTEEAVAARLDLIADYFQARQEMLPSTQRDAAAEATPVYHPVPPETLFLDDKQWRAVLAKRRAVEFTPFDAPEDMDGVVNAGGRPPPDFSVARTNPDLNPFDTAKALIDKETERPVVITAHSEGSRDRLASMLTEHGASTPVLIDSWSDVDTHEAGKTLLGILDIDHGFAAPDRIVVSEQDILGERLIRAARKRRQAEHFITEVSSLNAGDIVVHVDNGIGRYEGLETLTVGRAPHDCLRVLYAGDDRLYVPVENIDVLSRYGAEDSAMQLDRLGATAWQARKARVKERIREIADQLLKVAAERTMQAGEEMQPQSAEFEEFCARFSFSETDDQQQAIDDVVEDLGSGRAMDRLVCGDVGFGKTEVALRAAFVAAMTGTQVALVVPTTLLAAQHYKTFSERFTGLPIRIEQLSRLVPSGKAATVREELSAGMINIVIGTQSLLAKSIEFDNLGLLIVDEEQHFGVAQKERLKQLKANVHVLTLTATPIPRTLQMALAGVREMSIIATPPVDRLAVRTFVLPYDPVMIREAIRRETYRGGQTFYVCPRVSDISRVHDRLKDLVPEAKVGIAHGQMPTIELENVMTGFSDAEYDILLTTNIIEAGLDIPSANTMIVHRADRFGLAQLYQLRGRIGRSKTRAYAYLTLPPGQKITETASKRLAVMQSLDTLGAGFTLASHDLDIRGAGNLLGDEQSGHIKEVGVELYQQLLEEAITKLRDGESDEIMEEGWSPQISVGTSVLIPDTYVSDLSVRLGLYRRLSVLSTRDDIDGLAAEMIDRFGPLPDEVKNLMEIMEIKQFCKTASIEKIDAGPKGAVLSFRNNEFANPEGLIGFIHKEAGRVRLRPDHSLLCMRRWDRQQERLDGVRDLVSTLARISAAGG